MIGSNARHFYTVPTHLYVSQTTMAAFAVARSRCVLLSGLKASFKTFGQVKHGAASAAVAQSELQQQSRRWYSVSHLSVQERIDRKRNAALIGGGQKRIDAQHKRVNNLSMRKCLSVWCIYLFACLSVRLTFCLCNDLLHRGS